MLYVIIYKEHIEANRLEPSEDIYEVVVHTSIDDAYQAWREVFEWGGFRNSNATATAELWATEWKNGGKMIKVASLSFESTDDRWWFENEEARIKAEEVE